MWYAHERAINNTQQVNNSQQLNYIYMSVTAGTLTIQKQLSMGLAVHQQYKSLHAFTLSACRWRFRTTVNSIFRLNQLNISYCSRKCLIYLSENHFYILIIVDCRVFSRIRNMGGCQPTLGGTLPPPFPPFPLSPSPVPSLPFPHPLEVGPIKSRGSGERCKLPQRGLRQSPSRNRIWCIFTLKSDLWCQQFWRFSWESNCWISWLGTG